MRHTTAAVFTVAALLALPAVAQAHVTMQPGSAPAAGADVTESLRVPNEQDNASTTKVAVQFPPGFISVSYQAVPGWTTKVATEKLAAPVQTDDGPVDTQVSTVTFTADSAKSGIQPGQFQDFPLSLLIPDKPGTTLAFKAVQTYSNGDVVRWIGPETAEEPAATLKVTAAAANPAMAHDQAASASKADDGGSDSDSDGLAVAALIVGGLGLLAGGWALVATRRRPSPTEA